MPPEIPFNPLDKTNLGRSVANALLNSELKPLGSLTLFNGAGIYAIYYSGDFEPYASFLSISGARESRSPIYVGKAIPQGGRKGNYGLEAFGVGAGSTQALYKRLCEHAESIRAAQNLGIEEFSCRYLVVDDIWIPLGENLLIREFRPIWNLHLDGFGNHDPGAGRYNGMRSLWDTVHPGRPWAAKCKQRDKTGKQILEDFEKYLTGE